MLFALLGPLRQPLVREDARGRAFADESREITIIGPTVSRRSAAVRRFLMYSTPHGLIVSPGRDAFTDTKENTRLERLNQQRHRIATFGVIRKIRSSRRTSVAVSGVIVLLTLRTARKVVVEHDGAAIAESRAFAGIKRQRHRSGRLRSWNGEPRTADRTFRRSGLYGLNDSVLK